jgi:5-formyltetrahydrofolate cyclo-ligase
MSDQKAYHAPRPPQIERAALRRELIARREALSAEEHARLSTLLRARLEEVLNESAARSIGFYWPIRNEPDITETVARWLNAAPDRIAALPVADTTQRTLSYRLWNPEMPLRQDHYGIWIPENDIAVEPELLLVPTNGFDSSGIRIGYGGGFFDRKLSAHPPRFGTVGIAFELACVPHAMAAPHDVPLDCIVTEARVLRVCNAR